MNEIFENLYEMTAFSNIIAEPQFLIMYAIAFVLLYLGIKKQYEPLLLVPIAFGVLLANFPGGDMGVIQADENGMVMVNGVLKNIWEMPLQYIENSPLFNMDKVTTPILIMHNDADGHVPWYQGIEYFIALKRLQKPVWLLNYTGEPHWPMRLANRIDFQKRMFQFFHHYLQNAPMPKWMNEGVPAVDQDFELGY